MKKKFCQKQRKPSYRPAVFKQGSSKTYLNIYYTTKNGEYKHVKHTFDLGRIFNIEKRRERGEEIANKINWWLEKGYYYEEFEEWKASQMIEEEKKKVQLQSELQTKDLLKTNIIDAVQKSMKIKLQKTKKHPLKITIRSNCKLFINYLNDNSLNNIKANDFLRGDAQQYLLHQKEKRKWANNTYNGKIGENRKIWTEIVDLGMALKNPFSKLPQLAEEDVTKRPFEDYEAKIVLQYAYINDRILFYAMIIDYLCFIRPGEISKLRFENVDLNARTIKVIGNNAKGSKTRYTAIPDEFIDFFKAPFWEKYPKNYFIFGSKFIPNPNKPVHRTSIWRRHFKLLNKLHELGKLENREGLTFYSWKSTGITSFIDQIGIAAAQEQAGHADIKTTLAYKKKEKVNRKVRGFTKALFDPK